jgi:hypothetical protein
VPHDLRRDPESEPGSIPVEAIVETGRARGAPRAGEPAVLFLPAIRRVILLVFLLVSTAIDVEKCFSFKWL